MLTTTQTAVETPVMLTTTQTAVVTLATGITRITAKTKLVETAKVTTARAITA
jgi:hypothetical protein